MRRQPSLLLRAALAVVAAFALVFTVLFTAISYNTLKRDTGDIDREFLAAAQRFARALDDLASDADALALLRLQNRLRLVGGEGDVPAHLMLARRDGSLREATQGAPALDMAALPEGISAVDIGGVALRVYAASGTAWRVAVVDEAERRRRDIFAGVAGDLALYLLWAMPIMLLPVWFAVRTALRPLRQLAGAVAARRPDDTTPVSTARSYAELQPLVGALNRLFERVATSLAREKAFVHDAAHELRTPLAVIGTQAHVLLHAEGADRAGAGQRLQGAVERASHLAHQLLRLAQADALALAPRVPVDVMNLARDTLAGFAEAAGAQGSELSLSGPDSAVLNTDPRALRSMLENGVDNALRYGGAGVAVDVTLRVSGAQWQLRVADTGPGIAAEHREQAFERFWRGKAELARGAGLGLAIVREAARSLGGDAHLTDGPAGRGCVLVVQLPL